ncbi:MAG: hypothetical protein J2P57_00105 [Acidimicrobiaceae bacterium]|nr:hypothetical protein [Acidimicrobiaceae bacterium]
MRRIKSALKACVRPFLGRYVRPYIDKRISAAFQERSDLRELMAEAPLLLSQSASFAAAQRQVKREHDALRARVDELGKRLEFVRREVLVEASRGLAAESNGEDTQTRVLNPARLEALEDGIRLNLGCGHIPLEGFVNVDARALDGVDLVADIRSLPFEANSVAAIHSAHLLEHFPLDDLKRSILPYWYSLLRAGGSFTAIVPDAETMIGEYVSGNISFEDLRRVTFGEQEYVGDFHHNMFSQKSLRDLLEHAGFEDVAVVVSGRRNGLCYEMEMRATKPARRSSGELAGST